MAMYRKKPVAIEAMQFRAPEETLRDIDYAVAFDDWIKAHQGTCRCFYRGANFVIETLEGEMTASANDYIICGVKGELYPCKPDIFLETYEAI